MRSECRVSTLRENSRFQLCTQPCRRGGRVWHCLHSLPVLPRRRPQRCDASFLDDARLPPPLSLARSREEANHRATKGRVLTFDRGLWSNNNNGWNGSDTVDTRIGERKPVRIIPEQATKARVSLLHSAPIYLRVWHIYQRTMLPKPSQSTTPRYSKKRRIFVK